jgi:DNA-binding CsgD family transcriptional regulator
MGCSNRLRLGEVTQALRLVGECRDLGHDARLWCQHAALGLRRLFGARLVATALAPPGGFNQFRTATVAVVAGLDRPEDRQYYLELVRPERQLADPFFRRTRDAVGGAATLRRVQIAPDREFYSSPTQAVFSHPFGLDDFLYSERPIAHGSGTLNLNSHRAAGDRRFTPRDARLLALAHDELARLVGPVLSDGRDPLTGLPPRLRQTLDCLLDGDGEKQAALRLGVSPHTVHTYTVALYRRFGAGSRAELLTRFVRRR